MRGRDDPAPWASSPPGAADLGTVYRQRHDDLASVTPVQAQGSGTVSGRGAQRSRAVVRRLPRHHRRAAAQATAIAYRLNVKLARAARGASMDGAVFVS